MPASEVGASEDVAAAPSGRGLDGRDDLAGVRPFQGMRAWWEPSWCPSPLAAALWPPAGPTPGSR